MVLQYKPPVNVSPFIRFSRWALLIGGILYGTAWDARYGRYEARMRPKWDKEREERDLYLKEEKERRSKREIEELSRLGSGSQQAA